MIDVTHLSGGIGAQINGVDPAAELTPSITDAIRAALLEHIVLVFRKQSLPPAAQLTFTRHFGEPIEHPLKSRPGLREHPQVMLLENRPGKPGARNDFWHSDISHEQCPPSVSMLHAIQVPAGRGDTQLCNMYAAYDDLSPGMRAMLAELTALHSGEATARRNNAEATDALPITAVPPPVSHPVVRTHPETDCNALFVNPFFYHPARGHDASGECSAARLSVPARDMAREHLPPSLGNW
ncbi:MAG: TauD/TfdA family dioxygenase [Gammaproteobacteria bacterium]|nr:TauD/TfdA family dioxygenase [Gammaproteobacteria bacterium]